MKRSPFSRSMAAGIAAALLAVLAGQLSVSANKSTDVGQVPLLNQTTAARATFASHGVLVEWTSDFENQILGFNVFRISRGQRLQVNASLIAGPTMVFQGRSPSFAWFDPTGTADSTYEVESIGLHGESLLVTGAVAAVAASLPAYRQASLLAEVGRGKATEIPNPEWHDSLGSEHAPE
ncbi:MAG TPA: hypothetical protein VHP99_01190, partial [Pyrinomonadaceae bacterium]|nr:hypothetical protein [Pyrinomonadaceae bacterium]